MALIVQKFGGSSVADADRIRNVARIITDTYQRGNQVVADVIDVARNMGHRKALSWEPGGEDAACGAGELKSRWYVRAAASADALRAALPGCKLLARRESGGAESACLTEGGLTRPELMERLAGLDVSNALRVLD